MNGPGPKSYFVSRGVSGKIIWKRWDPDLAEWLVSTRVGRIRIGNRLVAGCRNGK